MRLDTAPAPRPTLKAARFVEGPYLTRSEQRLEWLQQQRAVRRLSDDEWRELARCEHAIYCRVMRG